MNTNNNRRTNLIRVLAVEPHATISDDVARQIEQALQLSSLELDLSADPALANCITLLARLGGAQLRMASDVLDALANPERTRAKFQQLLIDGD